MGEYLAVYGFTEIVATVGLDLYVALGGHVVFLVAFVGWALYANRNDNRVENRTTSTGEHSTPVNERPTSTGERSTSIDERPTSTGERSTPVNERPASTDERSTSIDERPASTDERSTSTEGGR